MYTQTKECPLHYIINVSRCTQRHLQPSPPVKNENLSTSSQLDWKPHRSDSIYAPTISKVTKERSNLLSIYVLLLLPAAARILLSAALTLSQFPQPHSSSSSSSFSSSSPLQLSTTVYSSLTPSQRKYLQRISPWRPLHNSKLQTRPNTRIPYTKLSLPSEGR